MKMAMTVCYKPQTEKKELINRILQYDLKRQIMETGKRVISCNLLKSLL